MKISSLALVALLAPALVLMVSVPDVFEMARKAVEAAKKNPFIDYNTFCSEKHGEGEDKVACRMEEAPSVGFLVCKDINVGEAGSTTTCTKALNDELTSIRRVSDAGIKTVLVSPQVIANVTCGVTVSNDCSGFLEGWVADGKFENVRDRIVRKEVLNLTEDVQTFTKGGLSETVEDLEKIVKYMNQDPSQGSYRQICDLQGFFLFKGGFVVNDVPYVAEGVPKNHSCWLGEPTTEEVLIALNGMIETFSG